MKIGNLVKVTGIQNWNTDGPLTFEDYRNGDPGPFSDVKCSKEKENYLTLWVIGQEGKIIEELYSEYCLEGFVVQFENDIRGAFRVSDLEII